MCHKKKFKFEDYKNCLEAIQLDNKINDLQKSKIDKINVKENHNKFIKNYKIILKTQQKFKNERHSVFNGYIKEISFYIQITAKECNQLIQ